jgi:flagellar biosynthesis/type III secretory pathway chaperone
MSLTTAHSMTTTGVNTHAAPAPAAPHALRAPIAALTDALHSETHLLDELVSVMARQRQAVGADDLQAIDDSVFATHRVLLTLGEARRRRKTLNRLIGDTEELSLRELDDVLGDWMTDALRAAREGLQNAAQRLSKEVEINRSLLRQALANGEDYVRELSANAEPQSGYGREGARRDNERSGGLLLNRTV